MPIGPSPNGAACRQRPGRKAHGQHALGAALAHDQALRIGAHERRVDPPPLAGHQLGMRHHRVADAGQRRAQRADRQRRPGRPGARMRSPGRGSACRSTRRRSRRWRWRSPRSARRTAPRPSRAPGAGPGGRDASSVSIGQPDAFAKRTIPACLPEQLPRSAVGFSPSRTRRWAVSVSYGAWTWFWSTALVRPARRRISCTRRTWRSSPEWLAAMIASASVPEAVLVEAARGDERRQLEGLGARAHEGELRPGRRPMRSASRPARRPRSIRDGPIRRGRRA